MGDSPCYLPNGADNRMWKALLMEDANTGCRVWTLPTVGEGLWERTGSCLLKPCQSSLLEARVDPAWLDPDCPWN